MHVWKLMIMALGSGALAGTIGGTTIHPTLKPAPEQPWRQALAQRGLTADSYTVEAPPQDLAPQGWTYGAAQAFPRDIERPAARRLGYRWDDGALPPETDDNWNNVAVSEDEPAHRPEVAPVADDVPAVEAAEAAREAALDATDQGLDAAPTALPAT